jgi:repressor LexA
MDRLTPRQQAVLEAIRAHLDEEGVPPTLRELAGRMRMDPKSAAQHLDRLERKGFLSRRPGESRNIRLTEKARSPRGVPLLGQIAAGQPLLAEENLEGRVAMEDFFGPEGGVFLLRVTGRSMEGAGLCDGDLAAIQADGQVRDGDIAAVLLDDEATVKRLFREKSGLRLEPDNPDFEPLLVPAGRKEVRIIGPVVGLVRKI